jgi:hypothetical protein
VPEASETVWSSTDGHVKRAGPGPGPGVDGDGPGGDGTGRDEERVVGVKDCELWIELEEGLAEAEVTEIRWVEEVMALEIEATTDGAEDALEEAGALEVVCLWSAMYLWT